MKKDFKKENEYLDNVVNALGYVVINTEDNTIKTLDTKQECERFILSWFQTDARCRSIGINNFFADALVVVSIKDIKIHKSTLRSYARDFLRFNELSSRNLKPSDFSIGNN